MSISEGNRLGWGNLRRDNLNRGKTSDSQIAYRLPAGPEKGVYEKCEVFYIRPMFRKTTKHVPSAGLPACLLDFRQDQRREASLNIVCAKPRVVICSRYLCVYYEAPQRQIRRTLPQMFSQIFDQSCPILNIIYFKAIYCYLKINFDKDSS
jgi:hypothetical protein